MALNSRFRRKRALLAHGEMVSGTQRIENSLNRTESPTAVGGSLNMETLPSIQLQQTIRNGSWTRDIPFQGCPFFGSLELFPIKKYALADKNMQIKNNCKNEEIASNLKAENAYDASKTLNYNTLDAEEKSIFYEDKQRGNRMRRVFEVPRHFIAPSITSKRREMRTKLNFSVDLQRTPLENDFRLTHLKQNFRAFGPKADLNRVSLYLSFKAANKTFQRHEFPKSSLSPDLKHLTTNKMKEDLNSRIFKAKNNDELRNSHHIEKSLRTDQRKTYNNNSLISKIEVNPETKSLQSSIYCLGITKGTNLKHFLS